MAFFELSSISEALVKEKGSKFYAYAYPVKTKEEVENCLLTLRKKYYDARHHCYAFRIGMTGEMSIANDDGEPSHSAGDPILGQIRSRHLTNTLVVVIRYFGGTLLGVRGLIDAYKTAASEALDKNILTEIIPLFTFKITFPYEKTAEIQRVLHPFSITVIKAVYEMDCMQILQVPQSQEMALRKALIGMPWDFEVIAEEEK